MAQKFDKQQVLVIGGGYAGALAAVRLAGKAKERAAVTLLDPRTELVQRLRLHQLATGQKVRAYDLARLTGKRVANVRGKAVAIDPGRGRAAVERDGRVTEIPFDQVLLAVGSGVDLDSVPGVRENAHALSDPRAAERLWDALRELRAGSRVVVCGGGFTGIEAASEIADRRPKLRVSLLSASRLGAVFSERETAWFGELPRPATGLTQAMAGGRQRRSPVLAHGWSLAQRDGRQSGFRGQVLRQQHHRIGRAGRVPDAALEEEAQ